jgi:hypothetical protein
VDNQANLETNFSLTPALSNILSNMMQPPPSTSNLSTEELDILRAQTEAMAKLGILPGLDIPPRCLILAFSYSGPKSFRINLYLKNGYPWTK